MIQFWCKFNNNIFSVDVVVELIFTYSYVKIYYKSTICSTEKVQLYLLLMVQQIFNFPI